MEAVNLSGAVNGHYYALREKKLGSFTCEVMTDWSTLPPSIMAPVKLAGMEPLENAKLKLKVDAYSGLSFTHEYPKDTGSLRIALYDKFLEWYTSVIQGFFMTWGAKAMSGPMGDKYLTSSMEPIDGGTRLHVDVPTQQITITVTKENVVTQIFTHGENFEIDEHPAFTPSAEGLLLTGMDAVNTNKAANESTHVKYDMDYQTRDGFELPHQIHLMVNDNMNMHFALEGCTAVRAAEVQIPAGTVSTTQSVTPRTATKSMNKQ